MINSVRQTVMSVLNKNNYGYISPSDFNLFAKQAQLDLFEDYFYSYNYQINKENARKSGTGYADITKGLEEVIDTFSSTLPLIQSVQKTNGYFLPSLLTTNNDYYLINKMLINNKVIVFGATTGTVGGQNKIIDITADFNADGVDVGDIVGVEIGGIAYNLVIIAINTTGTELTVAPNVVNTFPLNYTIYKKKNIKEAEKVTHSKITMLNNSILTSPNLTYPAYTQEGLIGDMFPDEEVNHPGQVVCQYIRFPFVPKWTFVTLANGEPAFDASQPDYQDFELPNDDEVNLINKILQYAGMSIREVAAVQFAQAKEQGNNQEEK